MPPLPRRIRLVTASNLLTVSRLAILPLVLVALVHQAVWWAAGLMVLAYLTDLADGRLARWRHEASPSGRLLDTFVDFFFLYGLFIAFYFAGRIPTYQFVTVYLVKLGTTVLQYAWMNPAAPRDLPATPLRKVAGAFGYAYVLLLTARLVAPDPALLREGQMAVFVGLTLAMLADAAGCWLRTCPRPE